VKLIMEAHLLTVIHQSKNIHPWGVAGESSKNLDWEGSTQLVMMVRSPLLVMTKRMDDTWCLLQSTVIGASQPI
jgi:hypothetical protein